MDPLFLTIDEIVAIHDDQVNRYGGSHGLRDEGLLLSAAAMPEMGFGGEYLHHDLFEMAAAYLFHIVMDHPRMTSTSSSSPSSKAVPASPRSPTRSGPRPPRSPDPSPTPARVSRERASRRRRLRRLLPGRG